MARPSSYTEQTADLICLRLAEGLSLVKICEMDGMPDKSTVFRWLFKHEEFRDKYAHAREHQAEAMFEEMLSVAYDGSKDWITKIGRSGVEYEAVNHEALNRSRLIVDTIKWCLARMSPRKYGEKLTQDIDLTSRADTLTDDQRKARVATLMARGAKRKTEAQPQHGDDDGCDLL